MNARSVDWAARTSGYIEEMNNPYHAHRVEVLRAMIPDSAMERGVHIFDFGCGDGFLIEQFVNSGATVRGCDIQPGMVQAARNRLANCGIEVGGDVLSVGGVEQFEKISDATLDGLLALNVLAYLSPDEERIFYEQAQRTVRHGGFLLCSHSNNLFDLFSLNRYTVNFIADFLLHDRSYTSQMERLVSHHDHPAGDKSIPLPIRENPLCYAQKLFDFGFKEIRQEFINRHEAPPPILETQTYPDTLGVPECERWKLYFTRSTFVSLSVHDQD